jgi:hypothetical protein
MLAMSRPCDAVKETQSKPNKNINNDGNGQANGQTNGRISAKQHQYVIGLAQNRGMTKKELNAHCIGDYGAGVDFISRKDASALIEALSGGQSGFRAKIPAK